MSFKGLLITKLRRYLRFRKLKNLHPLTSRNMMDLNIGDAVVIIKRNETIDLIALSCGSVNCVQEKGVIADWYVYDKTDHNLFIRNKSNANNAVIGPDSSMLDGFNRLKVKPHFLSEEFELRMYFRKV